MLDAFDKRSNLEYHVLHLRLYLPQHSTTPDIRREFIESPFLSFSTSLSTAFVTLFENDLNNISRQVTKASFRKIIMTNFKQNAYPTFRLRFNNKFSK